MSRIWRRPPGVAGDEYVHTVTFFDSDVYKWLEAVGWTLADPLLGEETATDLADYVARTCTLLSEAQAEDGYLNSYYQVLFPGRRFAELQWGHELYCAGHLIQGAIAVQRGSGDSGLLHVARRCADLIVRSFGTGEGQIDGLDGHPRSSRRWSSSTEKPGSRPTWTQPGTSSTNGATGCSDQVNSVLSTGRTTPLCGRPPLSPGMPCASSTCWPVLPTSMQSSVISRFSKPQSGCGRRW